MPWPRFHPKPGLLGRQRRLLENIHEVARRCGKCESLVIHSAVFDTEAINYFLSALPKLVGAKACVARILPDGIISTRRYPLTFVKKLTLKLRALRRLINPMLQYSFFEGDRTGSDANFVDRIYVLDGFPHEYPQSKVVRLPRIVDKGNQRRLGGKSALVIDQPLRGFRQMREDDIEVVANTIERWGKEQGVQVTVYRPHPKDQYQDLKKADYQVAESPSETLEVHLASNVYDFVIGVRSTGLIIARQLQPPESRVVSFGLDRFISKNDEEASRFLNLFRSMGIEVI
jgi:hypothetical protein